MAMHNYILRLSRFFLFVLFFTLSACSSIQTEQTSNSLNSKIEQTRVVLVGETHTNYGHHLNQLEIIKKTHEKWGSVGAVLSIGLEMVQQPFQSYLDDYIAGKITERQMLKGVEWYSRWRYDFRLYRPIFDYAKQHKTPLIALNIPQELTRKISKGGIASLSSKERKFLPTVIDKSNSKYTARLKEVFGQHSHGKVFNQKGFNKFEEAQLAWDEGMAFASSNYLTENPKKRMVILAGSGHLINRDGIPSRLDRLLELSGKQRSVVILSHDEKPYTSKEADFSLKTKNIKLPPAGLIGIGMKDTDQGVQISSVTKTGAANQAGLQKGDYLIQLNETKVKTSSDVSLWRLDKNPNEKANVVIRRNKKLLKKILILGG